MNDLINKVKFLGKLLRAFIPSSLPVGMTEFNSWSDEIIELSRFPNNDSIKWSLAIMIMHMDSTSDKKPKLYFVKALRKSAANQVAAAVVQDLKQKQELERQKAAEVTATQVTSDEPIQN